MRPEYSVHAPAILLLLLLVCPAAHGAEVPCPGNCNGDGSVTVDELVRGVNMALGNLAIAECPAFDVGGDGVITVDELIKGVNAALNGCATEPSGTPTPSTSPGATETVMATPGDTPISTVVPTESALPTRTDTPVWSPVPSATPTNTFPPTITHTPTLTPSPTATYTSTPTWSPTPTATVPLPPGPVITFFGLARADNTLVEPSGTTLAGIPIYERPTHFGFIILVEGHPGTSGKSLSDYGTASRAATGSSRASLQLLANNVLGDGSPAVCDVGPRPDEPIGGVPAVNPIDFGPSQQITDAINDFACRFDFHTGADTACTLNELGNFAFASKAVEPGTRQYCAVPAIGRELAFPSGDTTLTVQLADSGGNVGNTATMILRIP